MFKNQSIKSFFTSSSNTTPSKSAKNEDKDESMAAKKDVDMVEVKKSPEKAPKTPKAEPTATNKRARSPASSSKTASAKKAETSSKQSKEAKKSASKNLNLEEEEEKENKRVESKNAKKKNSSKKSDDSSDEIAILKSEDSQSSDSSMMNLSSDNPGDHKKRKLVLESSNSESEEATKKLKNTKLEAESKKKSPPAKKKTTSTKKTSKKSDSENESSDEVVIEDEVKVETKKTTTKKKTTGTKKRDSSSESDTKKSTTKKAAKKKSTSPKRSVSPAAKEKSETKAKATRAKSKSPTRAKKSTSRSKSKSPTRDSSPESIQEVKPEKTASKKKSPSPKKKSTSPKRAASPSSPKRKSRENSPTSVKKEAGKSPEKAQNSIMSFFGKKQATNTIAVSGPETATGAKGEEFLPSKTNYDPISDAIWAKNDPVPYKALAQTLYCMEKTTKRLELLAIVSNYLRSLIALSPNDLVPSIYMLTNKVAPDYESIELGIGDTVLFKALAEATGCTVAKLKTEFQSKGDIGLVAEANRCNQKLIFKPKKLTVSVVYNKLREIALISGNSSQTKKTELIKGLLVSCDSIEARYLMRSLAGKLRNGLGEQSILAALGHAFATTYTTEDGELVVDEFKKMRKLDQIDEIKKLLEKPVQTVKQSYYQCPNYDKLISEILKHGLCDLEKHCKLTPGIPLKPMLAYPTKGIHEVLKRFEEADIACEYKYDGERAQVHILEDGSLRVYSRNSENNTSKYPDVIEFLQELLHLKPKKETKKDVEVMEVEETPKFKVTSAIIDAEVVAYDTEKHIIQPFQKLSTRKRKDAASEEIKVQVCLFAFDLIYLNGESLIDMSLRKRREMLYQYFPRVESKLMFAEKLDTNNVENIQEFLDKSIKDGCEGLMIKTLDKDAHYEISKRSHNWLKLKKDYLDGVGDTLDLVAIGGYLGTGKRTGVYGGYLLACYNPEEEEYQTICKLGTGLKDNDLQTLFEELSKEKIDKPKSYYRVNSELEQPDHWFEPKQVWEIKCADFSLSPVHTAALGLIEGGKGVSMRFPRFLRVRDDKKPEQATSNEQVVEMYKNQQQMINQLDKDKSEDEEE